MNTIVKRITAPAVSFFMNIVSLTLAVIGLTAHRNDWLFLIIFVIPFVTTIILTLVIGIFKWRYDKLQKKENTAFRFIFSENLRILHATLKDCQNNLWNSYTNFCESIGVDGTEKEIDENAFYMVYQTIYRDIKKASDMIFSRTVESLKKTIEYNLNTINNKGCKISVCIKQLNKVHKKQGLEINDDLKVYAIFRDKCSYDSGREIGRIYTVNRASTFSSCIQADNPREAFYIENDIIKAIRENRFKSENKEEVIANETYTATMVVPITQNIMTDKVFYGFLCVDSKVNSEDIFKKEELHSIMQSYSDILATYYHSVNMYFPIIFDYIYKQQERSMPIPIINT